MLQLACTVGAALEMLIHFRRDRDQSGGQVRHQFANFVAFHNCFLHTNSLSCPRKSFVSAEQQRLNGGFAQLQNIRNLAIIHLLILVHDDRDPLPFGQCLHPLPDGGQALPPDNRLFGSRRSSGMSIVSPLS